MSHQAVPRKEQCELPANTAVRRLAARLAAVAIVFVAAAGLSSNQLPAASFEGEPWFRIEAGMHLEPVRRIAVSNDRRTLVTSSYDKTIRVWNVADSKLQKVLRVPLGMGYEGSLFAVALSPDGKTVAAGGWTRDQQFVYLINIANGAIIRSLGTNPETTNDLAFSPDGRSLLAALSGGVRMFDVETGAVIAEDKSYGGAAYGVAFRDNGTFATVADDGLVRLYAQDGGLLARLTAPSGKRPMSLAFTPDGGKLAVGYSDAPKVDILSTGSNEWLPQPDLAGMAGGDLAAVSWSSDGSTLYAGGTFRDASGGYPVVRWRDQGSGPRSFIYRGAQTIFDLESYGPDAVAIAVALPSIAVIEGDKPILELFPPMAAMGRGEKGVVTTDDTAQQVRFSLDAEGKRPVLFDAAAFELTDVRNVPDGLHEADTTSLKITGWDRTREPALNGKRLAMDTYEMSLSLAIAPDKASFILGTGWNLRRYDAEGQLLWRASLPGRALGVNLSKDGALVVAALGDGTVRWFRASDGMELLALFVHNTDKRWVAWTPSRFYAASPGSVWMACRSRQHAGAGLLSGVAPSRPLLSAGYRRTGHQAARRRPGGRGKPGNRRGKQDRQAQGGGRVGRREPSRHR